MERGVEIKDENITITWLNKKNCVVVFLLNENEWHTLYRPSIWVIGKMFHLDENTATITKKEEARKIWTSLIEDYNFEVLEKSNDEYKQ